ncbi:hypothetical protein KKD49_15270, partial [Myxococcota bacterium]|nr:hypothetical protein [Myxococcota bacterium]
ILYWEEKKGEWRVSHEEHTISVKIQEKGIVRSPAPSIVTSIHVGVDEIVKKGDRLFTLEAMKMELIVSAQEAGRIEKIEVHPGSQVFAGGTLLRMSSTDSGDKKELLLKNFEKKPGYAEALELFNGALFGFECSDREIDSSLKILADIPEEHLPPAVNSIFSTLINTSRLFEITSPLRSFNVIQGKSGPASGRALLSILIRRPAAVIHTLPHDFRQKLMDVLGVYGVNVLETGPDLTYALYRLRKVLNSSDLKRRALTDLLTFIAGFDSSALPAPPVELYSALHVFSTDVKGSSHQTDLAESIRNSLFEITSINREFTSYRNAFSELINKNVDDDLLEKAIMKLPSLELVPIWNLPLERIINLDISGKMIRRMWGDYIKDVHPLQITFAGCSSFNVFEESGKQEKTRLSVILPCGMEFSELFRLIHIHKAWSLEIFTVNNISLLDDLAGIMNESHLDYREITITSVIDNETVSYRSPIGGAYVIDTTLCQIHPASARRMKMWKFSDFKMKKISYSEGVTLFEASAREFPEDRRLIAFTEVVFPALDSTRTVKRLPEVEKNFRNACQAIRDAQFGKSFAERLHWNHLIMHVSPLPELTQSEMMSIAKDLTPHGARLGLDQVVVYTEKKIGDTLRTLSFRIRGRGNEGFHFEIEDPAETLIKPLNEEEKQEIKARRKGLNSPQTILRIILRDVGGRTTGAFRQFDILMDPSTGEQKYFELSGGYNLNQSIIFGVLSVPTQAHPDGLKRVVILSNPLRNMGSLSEDECRRIIAAMDLAKDQGLSVYWLPVSAGAKIDFDSGTENLDWTALVLRKIVNFTEQGGIIDILVAGVNVGAQSYFDAEATMVGTTRGFLVMTQDGSMVLTGKRALDFSGAVSAEDNLGIGGCERVMGPSGQAQALVNDLSDGHKLLLEHADLITHNKSHSSVITTEDDFVRDITSFSYPTEFNHGFKIVGDIFSEEFNPGRKKQFSVKPVMDAVRDRDSVVVDRWSYLTEGAEGVFVWETRIGGIACGLLGIDAVSYPRIGAIPPDGPENWSPSTLFPRGSYKLARGINAFNEQLPLVIFANLSGFDGSPESMRKWQLIHGAEIGRAIVNYKGPILLVVLSRYHGGAYVVFSTALNNQMEAVALKGSYASVIGGKAAANVVFSSQISRQVENDSSIRELKTKISEAKGRKKIILEAQLSELRAALNAKYSNELAVKFDSVHSVERAARVGSLKSVIEPSSLRPYIIDFLRIKLGLEGGN